MRQNPSDIASKTNKLKIVTFENSQPEEFLQIMKKFKIVVDGTGTTTVAGKINYLRNLLRGKALREFDKLSSQKSGTNNTHMKFIQEGLLGYLPPINALSKQNRVMRCLETSLSSALTPASRN